MSKVKPLDFTDPDVGAWMGRVVDKHPEMTVGSLYKVELQTLLGPMRDNVVGKIRFPAVATGKNMPLADWEAVFLWYELCQFWGFATTIEDVAKITNRQIATVKQKFHRVRREIPKINTI